MLEYDVACIPEPTLHQFDTGGAPLEVEFIKKLGEGIHSHVWKARVNGNIYALKLVSGPHSFATEQNPEIGSCSLSFGRGLGRVKVFLLALDICGNRNSPSSSYSPFHVCDC